MAIKKVDNVSDQTGIYEDDNLKKLLLTAGDRECVIVAGSVIEHKLARTLEKYFVSDNAVVKELLSGGNAPLATFSAKIKIVYALGLISKQLFKDLDRLRGIRNIFAHHIFDCSLKEHQIQQALLNSEFLKTKFKFEVSNMRHVFYFLVSITDITLTNVISKLDKGDKSGYAYPYEELIPILFSKVISNTNNKNRIDVTV